MPCHIVTRVNKYQIVDAGDAFVHANFSRWSCRRRDGEPQMYASPSLSGRSARSTVFCAGAAFILVSNGAINTTNDAVWRGRRSMWPGSRTSMQELVRRKFKPGGCATAWFSREYIHVPPMPLGMEKVGHQMTDNGHGAYCYNSNQELIEVEYTHVEHNRIHVGCLRCTRRDVN